MIERRRWPSATLPCSRYPKSSGPRCARSPVMRWSTPRCGLAEASYSNIPASPHMGCALSHRPEQPLDAMGVRVMGEGVLVGLFDHAPPQGFVPEALERRIDVGEILLHRNVMHVRLEQAVVVALQ